MILIREELNSTKEMLDQVNKRLEQLRFEQKDAT